MSIGPATTSGRATTRAGRRALALTLAAGAAALAGCGGSTKTVTVSAAPTTNTAPAEHKAATTTTTATSRTTGTPTTTTATAPQSPPASGETSTTRTAPEPAFTKHGSAAAETTGAEAAAAVAVVKEHGYTPDDVSEYHPNQTLRVLVGTRGGSGDGYGQQAFFFLEGKYIGTDSSQPSASLKVVSQSDTEVALAYPLYRAHDPLCCPSGGQTTVHFQLDDGKLVPLQPIPPVSSATGLSRQ